MSYFVVYDKQTGEIIRSGHCPSALIPLQVKGREADLAAMPATEPADDVGVFVDTTGTKPTLKAYPAAVRQARRTANTPKEPPRKTVSLEKLLAALKKRGIDIDPADVLD